MKSNRRFISLITILMLVLSVPCVSYAVSEEPVDVTENTTIVDVSGIEEGQAPSDELLVLVDEGTSKKTVSGIAQDAGASLDNISTLRDGTKLARVTIDGENDAQTVAEEIAADDAVLIVQPNYMYHLEYSEESTEASVDNTSLESSASEATSETSVENDSNKDVVSTEPSVSEDSKASNNDGKDEEVASDVEALTDATVEDVTASTNAVKVTNPLDGDSNTLINQWYLGSTGNGTTKAESAWNKLSSVSLSNKVVVAVIDTGVKLDHTDLKDAIIKEKCVTFNYGEKGTFTQWDGSDDDVGHGTHVCGLIAASANDNYGMKGIANDRAEIIAIDANVADKPKGGFTTQDMVLGINYAVDNGADIINMSIGVLSRDYLTETVIQAANDENVLVVCAAGNQGTSLPETPGDSSAAISVIAHDQDGNRATFSEHSSNYGVYKDISAPGKTIISTCIGSEENIDYYEYKQGTSMASPIVAGIAALIKSEDNSLNPREIKNYIYTSSGSESFDGNTSGFGKINALEAIQNVHKTAASPDKIVLNSTSLSLCPEEEFFLEYAVYPGAASTYADELTFDTSDTDVVTVDKNGKVTAVGVGSAEITAECGGYSQTCTVTVNADYEIIDFPGSIEKQFIEYTDFHKLWATRVIKGKNYAFEAFVKGYKINVTDINDYVTLKALSGSAVPVFRVYDPDGKEVSLVQSNYRSGTKYACTAEMSPAKTGEYNIQLLFDALGENITGVTYWLYTIKGRDITKAEVSGVTNRTYTGHAQTQSPIVKLGGAVLEYGTDYTLSYSNNVNAGTATMTVTGIGEYKGSQDVTFNINKAGNGLSVSGKTCKIKRSKVKKKAKSVAVGSVLTVKGANGTVRYAKVSGSKKLSINTSTGAVTIKKKTKKGTYKMKVNVTALGDANHYASTRQVTIKVKVK